MIINYYSVVAQNFQLSTTLNGRRRRTVDASQGKSEILQKLILDKENSRKRYFYFILFLDFDDSR